MENVTKDYVYAIFKENNKLSTKKIPLIKEEKIIDICDKFLKDIYWLTKENVKEVVNQIKEVNPQLFNISSKAYAVDLRMAWSELNMYYMWDYLKYPIKYYEFRRNIIDYVTAQSLEKMYNELNKNSSIIGYSHRRVGEKTYKLAIDDYFKADVNTNFAYGNSAYFYMILYFKSLPIINYVNIIFFRYAEKYKGYLSTENYSLYNSEWIKCLDNICSYVNSFYEIGEDSFVSKFIVNKFEELVNGLEFNVDSDIYCRLNDDESNSLFVDVNIFDDFFKNYKHIKNSRINIEKFDKIYSLYNNDIVNLLKEKETTEENKLNPETLIKDIIFNNVNLDPCKDSVYNKYNLFVFINTLYEIKKINSKYEILYNFITKNLRFLKLNNLFSINDLLYIPEYKTDIQVDKIKQLMTTYNCLNYIKSIKGEDYYSKFQERIDSIKKDLIEKNNTIIQEETKILDDMKTEYDILLEKVEKSLNEFKEQECYDIISYIDEYSDFLKSFFKKISNLTNEDSYDELYNKYLNFISLHDDRKNIDKQILGNLDITKCLLTDINNIVVEFKNKNFMDKNGHIQISNKDIDVIVDNLNIMNGFIITIFEKCLSKEDFINNVQLYFDKLVNIIKIIDTTEEMKEKYKNVYMELFIICFENSQYYKHNKEEYDKYNNEIKKLEVNANNINYNINNRKNKLDKLNEEHNKILYRFNF